MLIYVQKVIYGRTDNPKLKFKTFQKETIKKESKSGVRQSSIIGKFANNQLETQLETIAFKSSILYY